MNELRERYLRGLRTRHAADLKHLSRALAGRLPGALHAIRKRHAAVESETARILSAIDLQERSSNGQAEN